MFEQISGAAPRKATLPVVGSTGLHVVILGSLLLVPYLYGTDQLPEVQSIVAFVAAPPPPPLPPPPPAPAPAAPAQPAPKQARQPSRQATLTPQAEPAPMLAPAAIAPELLVAARQEGPEGGFEGGVPGGVAGGIVGGIIGGLGNEVPPPPPPPPPPAAPPAPTRRAPVRVGGQIQAPALIKRVNPQYPLMAQSARIEGLVILEAVVNEDGTVDDVRVLRSAGVSGVFDRAAIEAVRQWQYSPLQLNGRREKFVLTVTLSFDL